MAEITKENFREYLQQQEVVQNLPKKALISLRLYNGNNGSRQIEKSYVVRRGEVADGEAHEPDLEIMFDSKYLSESSVDMKKVIREARANGDFSIRLFRGKAELLWKYKGILKYRSALF